MGEIILGDPDRVVGKYDEDIVSMVTNNWRAIQETPGGLLVILNRCSKYFIFDMTMEEFHSINDNNESIRKKFKYEEEKLICQVCAGTGKLDWIENITKKINYDQDMYKSYVRNPDVPVRVLDEYYVSTPVLDEGQKLCKTCCGTGLHMFNENAYLEMLESENKSRIAP